MQNGQLVVVERNPYTRTGEVVVKAGEKIVFPDSTGNHQMDRGFEVPSILFKFTALAEGAVCDDQPSMLDRLVKIGLFDTSRNNKISESLPLQVADGHSSFRWTPKRPMLLQRGDFMQLNVSARESFDITVDGKRKRIDQIRVEATFEGDLLTYAHVAEKKFEAEAPLPG